MPGDRDSQKTSNHLRELKKIFDNLGKLNITDEVKIIINNINIKNNNNIYEYEDKNNNLKKLRNLLMINYLIDNYFMRENDNYYTEYIETFFNTKSTFYDRNEFSKICNNNDNKFINETDNKNFLQNYISFINIKKCILNNK